MDAKQMMRREFHRLAGEHARIMAEAAPHRAAYDALQPEIDALRLRQQALKARFRPIEERASAISNDMAALARGLNGKTGVPRPDGSVVMPEPEAPAAG